LVTARNLARFVSILNAYAFIRYGEFRTLSARIAGGCTQQSHPAPDTLPLVLHHICQNHAHLTLPCSDLHSGANWRKSQRVFRVFEPSIRLER
jgi:hypothetical protein